MSGALARAVGAISAVGSSLTLLPGGGVVTLDDFEFQAFEVPEQVRWGGAQQMAVHRFPGGARVVDAMGPDEADITWSGILGVAGPAADRAAKLDAMRQSGDAVTLTWGEFSRAVVVKSCSFDDRYGQTRYEICCCVKPDDTGTGGVAPSPLQQAQSDVNAALGFDLSGTLADAQSQLEAVQQVAVPLVTAISPSASVALLTGLGGVSAALTQSNLLADTTIGAAGDPNNVVSSMSALPSALSANWAAANGHVAGGYVARAAANVS